MRIIAGKARHKALITLEGEDITRPTRDRVKEGLFSAIQFELADKAVLDLFAGSGALALEALSRGAKYAVLIDESADAVDIMKTNAKNTDLMKQCRISRMDYSDFLKSASTKGEKFDIIFLDPPYARDIKNEIVKKVSRAGILADGGMMICESDIDAFTENETVYGMTLRRKYRYGKTFISLLIPAGEDA